VVVDLSLSTDTAKRGSETDTLTGIEGAIGSSAGDTFKGDANANWFQGGLGKDTFTGGGERDLYDVNAVAESVVGSTNRDVITDFDHLVDHIDIMGIDADITVAGNQAFRWVETAALNRAGRLFHLGRQHDHPRQQRRRRCRRVPDPTHRLKDADSRRFLLLIAAPCAGAARRARCDMTAIVVARVVAPTIGVIAAGGAGGGDFRRAKGLHPAGEIELSAPSIASLGERSLAVVPAK
jgi:hypothetical protein